MTETPAATLPRDRLPARVGGRLRRLLWAACWADLALALAVWAAVGLAGDRWWVGTLLAYGARWVWLVPSGVLAAVVVVSVRRRPWTALAVLAAAAAVVAGPAMGLCLSLTAIRPSSSASPAAPAGDAVRVMTCNTEGGHLDAAAFLRVAGEAGPDVIVAQEWSADGPGKVVADGLAAQGYAAKAEAGLFLAARWPVVHRFPGGLGADGRQRAMAYRLRPPAGGNGGGGGGGELTVVVVHLDTPREGLEALRARKWAGIAEMDASAARRRADSRRVADWAAGLPGPVVVAGDFNLPVDSAIYREAWAGWFADAFSSAGLGYGHTKFTRWWGVRIDHVLVGPGLAATRCTVGPDVGSDHKPVLADLERRP